MGKDGSEGAEKGTDKGTDQESRDRADKLVERMKKK
jgi:hypothetical protein